MSSVAVLPTSRARKARATWDHRPEPAAIRALQSWTAHNAVDVSLALSMARDRKNAADFRPEALLWLYAGADQYTGLIAHQLSLRVLLIGARAGLLVTAGRVGAATMDAMHRVRERDCFAADKRAVELQMRKSDYLLLRNAAESALLHAIRGGLEKYLAACGYTDKAEQPAPAEQAANHEHRQQRAA